MSRVPSADVFSETGEVMVEPGVEPATKLAEREQVLEFDKICIVACAPRFNMPNMLTTLFSSEQISQLTTEESFAWPSLKGELYVTREDANVVLHEMDMAQCVHSIPSNVPILVMHGTDDELIPVADASEYKEARSSIELCIIDGARHAFRGKKQMKQLLSTSSEFLFSNYNKFYSQCSI